MATDQRPFLPVDYVLLKVLEEKAASDPKKYAVLAALEGLTIISGSWGGQMQFQGPIPANNAMLPVPKWIVDIVGLGWLQHRSRAPKGEKFGETLKIERRGQGRRPAKDEWNLWFRDLRLADQFFQLRQTKTFEDTVAAVAQNNSVSEDIVKRAWTEHGANLKRAEESYRTTSGSGATDT